MRFAKRKGLVKMPSDPRGASLKRWCMEVMTTLQQLRDSGVDVPSVKPSSRYDHPFQITTGKDGADLKVSVSEGICYGSTSAVESTSTKLIPRIETPLAGKVDLVATTITATVGVWLRGTYSTSTANNIQTNKPIGTTTDMKFMSHILWTDFDIVLSTDYTTDQDYTGIFEDGFVHVFIGSVTVVSGEITAVDQWLRSDYTFPMFSFVHGVLSGDSDNLLSSGSDGLAKLDPSDVVVTLVGGTDITVTNDSATVPGQWTIDDDTP